MKETSINRINLRITSGTREWADHNINCVIGCLNNCRYCYAKAMARRFRRSIYETWPKMRIREDIIRRSFPKMAGRVMFPSSHDIVDIPSIKEACFITLGKLLESNNKVLITTKPRFSIIKEIHKRFSGYTKYIQFRFTITSMDNILLRFWEPNAPLFEERLESLKYAFDRNYKTSVSIEPFLDRQPRDLVNKLERFCTESIWIGKMNYIPSESNIPRDMRPFYYDVRKNYEINQLYKIYNDLKKRRKIKFKDSIKIALTNHS